MTTVTVHRDIVYATESGVELALDIYRPDLDGDVPAAVYLHGGAWVEGDKSADGDTRLAAAAALGIAIVSANYRLLSTAVFPAQIHDVKGIVRWVRAHGAEFRLATEKLGMWGSSAGAMLGSLLALTAGDDDLEGTVGGNADRSSAVQAVVHWFGPVDLVSGASRSWLERLILAPALEPPLFGAETIDVVAAQAAAASPIRRVTPGAPPFLIGHGDRDRVLPQAESEAFHSALSRAGVPSTFALLAGAGHEDHAFDAPANLAMTVAFLTAHIAS